MLSSDDVSTILANGIIPARGSCSVVVAVIGNKLGIWVNKVGAVTSDNAQISASTSATLTVKGYPPTSCTPYNTCS